MTTLRVRVYQSYVLHMYVPKGCFLSVLYERGGITFPGAFAWEGIPQINFFGIVLYRESLNVVIFFYF